MPIILYIKLCVVKLILCCYVEDFKSYTVIASVV